MAGKQAKYRPPNAGERIPNHSHGDLICASLLGFWLGVLALMIILRIFSDMNLRADRDRDVICAAAVKYPEFTLNDCPGQDSVYRKEIQQKIEQPQKALDAARK